jgi:hypothetical protein
MSGDSIAWRFGRCITPFFRVHIIAKWARVVITLTVDTTAERPIHRRLNMLSGDVSLGFEERLYLITKVIDTTL